MYPVSNDFLSTIKEATRTVKSKVTIGNVELGDNDIVSWSIDDSMASGDIPVIGGTTANKLNIELINTNLPTLLLEVPISIYVAIEITSNNYEWVKLGVFYAEYKDIVRGAYTTTIECFDSMSKFNTMKYVTQYTSSQNLLASHVISELESTFNVNFSDSITLTNYLPSTDYNSYLQGILDGNLDLTNVPWAISSILPLDVTVMKKFAFNIKNTDTNSPYNFKFKVISRDVHFDEYDYGIVDNGTVITFSENDEWVYFSIVDTTHTCTNVKELCGVSVLPTITDGTQVDYYNIPVANPISGALRNVLGELAVLFSSNAYINYNDEIDFKFINDTGFEINTSNYIDFKLTSDTVIKLSEIKCSTNNKDELFISGDSTGFAMNCKCSLIDSKSDLDNIFVRNYPLNYYSYSLKTQGFPHLQSGDKITITDRNNITRDLIILRHKLSYNGGLLSEFTTNAPQGDITKISIDSNNTVPVTSAIAQAESDITSAVQNATKLITGANGGTIVTKLDNLGRPSEICFINGDDINTADKVWRWNVNGLGFSKNGYTGNYSTAITADGKIVANFINTGELDASIVKTGMLKSLNNTSWINLDDGSFSLGSGKLAYSGGVLNINYENTTLGDALNEKAFASDVNKIKTYITVDNVGVTVGKNGSPFSITVDDDSIDFKEDNNIIATITGQKMTINKLESKQSSIIGKHEFRAVDEGFTVIKYIG